MVTRGIFGRWAVLVTALEVGDSGRVEPSNGALMAARMTIVSKGNALSTLPHGKSGIFVKQLSRWIGSIFQRVGAQLSKARLRVKSMHELDRLSEHGLREIGLRRVNLPGATPGLHGGTTGRFVWRSSLEERRD